VIVDDVFVGAGQGGTLAYATSRTAVGAAPGVDITEIPRAINIAPEGGTFSKHGDFPIGQRPSDVRAPAEARSAGEFTSNHDVPVEASNYDRSIVMTGYDAGMATFKATVTEVEVRPPEGWGDGVPPESQDMPIRITAGGKTIYTRRLVSSTGLGKPRPLGVPQEAELVRAGKLVYAQESLTLPGGAKIVAVIGDGATGAWAAEQSIRKGATKVYWISKHPASRSAPPAVRAELASFGLSADQIDLYWRAYNERNAGTFARIGAEVELEADVTAMRLDPVSGQVTITLSGGRVLHTDGVVSATGQLLDVPRGIDDANLMRFRLVTVGSGGAERLVALDAVDPVTNQPLGIRIMGAQMVQAKELLVDTERERFEFLIARQVSNDGVPEASRHVRGSIYQTNRDIPAANTQPLGSEP
jgi:hypothetical protein